MNNLTSTDLKYVGEPSPHLVSLLIHSSLLHLFTLCSSFVLSACAFVCCHQTWALNTDRINIYDLGRPFFSLLLRRLAPILSVNPVSPNQSNTLRDNAQ